MSNTRKFWFRAGTTVLPTVEYWIEYDSPGYSLHSKMMRLGVFDTKEDIIAAAKSAGLVIGKKP